VIFRPAARGGRRAIVLQCEMRLDFTVAAADVRLSSRTKPRVANRPTLGIAAKIIPSKNLFQRGPHLRRGIVNQDLQHWKSAKQLSAGFLIGLLVMVVSLEVTVDHEREAVGRRHIRSLNVSRLNLVD
jgi:hypothetical protein